MSFEEDKSVPAIIPKVDIFMGFEEFVVFGYQKLVLFIEVVVQYTVLLLNYHIHYWLVYTLSQLRE